MSIPKHPYPANLVLSILSSKWHAFWPGLLEMLEEEFGSTDYISESIPLVETHYYDQELGTPIFRRLLSFKSLVEQDRLPEIKLWTNSVEQNTLQEGGDRTFNLDPGILTFERLVLATGKNFTHRIYLGKGIWADLTLIYTRGNWQSLPWTFPDYGGRAIKKHLSEVRSLYAQKISSQQEQT